MDLWIAARWTVLGSAYYLLVLDLVDNQLNINIQIPSHHVEKGFFMLSSLAPAPPL